MFTLLGTPNQRLLVQQALDKCDFPFDRLAPKLKADTGRDSIPVEWADLSQWSQTKEANAAGTDDHHHHDDEHTHERTPGEDKADPLEARGRVLGLAWYSGKVSLDLSLESHPALAWEVFLSEGAHMVDFFLPNFPYREIFDIFHGGPSEEHGHDWFDKGSYWDFVGESFMGGFIHAYAPTVPVTIDFTHRSTLEIGQKIRAVLTPELVEPPVVEPEPPVEESPPLPPGPDSGNGLKPYFAAIEKGKVHDTHGKIKRRFEFDSLQEALDKGYTPCKVCKPAS